MIPKPVYNMLLERQKAGEKLHISMLDRDLLLTLRKENVSVPFIAALFGVSKSTIDKRVKEYKAYASIARIDDFMSLLSNS